MNDSVLEAQGWEKRVCDGGTVRWWKRFESEKYKCPPANRFTKSIDEYIPGVQASVDFHPDWTEIRMVGWRNRQWRCDSWETEPGADLDKAAAHIARVWDFSVEPEGIQS